MFYAKYTIFLALTGRIGGESKACGTFRVLSGAKKFDLVQYSEYINSFIHTYMGNCMINSMSLRRVTSGCNFVAGQGLCVLVEMLLLGQNFCNHTSEPQTGALLRWQSRTSNESR